jgi:hypothetical protein
MCTQYSYFFEEFFYENECAYDIDYVLNEFSYRLLKMLKSNFCMTTMVYMILI